MRLAVVIVIYRPRLAELQAGLEAIAQACAQGSTVAVHLWHNDEGQQATPGLALVVERLRAHGLAVRIGGGGGNLGFGRAINAILPAVAADHLLLLNQDAIPEPGALERLWAVAREDGPQVAAWELRQIPYEHPKDYDPVSGETGWVSGAAVLLRTQALREVGGFEPRFFMYCEDVDLSWRLRCAGWRLRYLPQCAVVHRTYAVAHEVKPLAAIEGAYANLCLRTRFAGRRELWQGLRQHMQALRAPPRFPGQHAGLRRALLRFARDFPHYRRTRCAAPDFAPFFPGADYEMRREGAFFPFLAQHEQGRARPPLSALVRASGDAQGLADWLRCLAQQTQPPQEVIVVGADDPVLHAVIARADLGFPCRPLPSLASPLSAIAAVHAQADWWLLFADDRERPYADHAEVLLQAALQQGADGAAGLRWVVQASAREHAAAHRLHAPRTVLAGPPGERPALLMHRRAAGAEPARIAEVDKLTTLSYQPPAPIEPATAGTTSPRALPRSGAQSAASRTAATPAAAP